jgi:CYTH domain-containing protein
MPLEIERKFLVTHAGWKRSVIRITLILDGLIASSNRHRAEPTLSRFARGQAGVVVMRR